jgi:Flp pilus assembly pilin Flp
MLKAYVSASSRLVAVKDRLAALRSDESGAAMIEYALVVGLVAVAAATVLSTFSTSIQNAFTAIGTHLDGIK